MNLFNGWNCSSYVVTLALNKHGIKRKETTIRKRMGVTKKGADEFKIIKCLTDYGLKTKENRLVNSICFIETVKKKLENNTLIVYCENNHWIFVESYYNKRIKFYDGELNKNGNEFTEKQFVRLCKNFDKTQKPPVEYFYFIEIAK
jgi:ABC-type bacteriocin/lantibiotic exporter with double-glycine peptidase domain